MLTRHQNLLTKGLLSTKEKQQCFEENKYKNFQYSSKLEGIEVTQVNLNIDQLVEKYKMLGNNG